MQTMTIDEFRAACRAQNRDSVEDLTFQCPRCKTLQSARDLIQAGAGDNFEQVERYVGFSCVGRWDDSKGCDWSLGGLFRIHELEVIDSEGKHHPRFLPMTEAAAAGGG